MSVLIEMGAGSGLNSVFFYFGASEMTLPATGRVFEEGCTGHKHVEWIVQNPLLLQKGDVLESPTLQFGNLEYILKLNVGFRFLQLYLGRMVELPKSPVRFISGVKRRDGSYHHDMGNGILVQDPKNETWVGVKHVGSFSKLGLESFLSPDGLVTFFLYLNAEDLLEVDGTCDYGLGMMNPLGKGRIREEECSDHKHVEWSVNYASLTVSETVSSPIFEIGTQRYLMDLTLSPETFGLRLFRMGPSVEYAVRYFAGVKRADGFYHHISYGGELDQKQTCVVWTVVASFINFGIKLADSRFLDRDGQVTFFIRTSVEHAQSGSDVCIRDLFQMNTPGEGFIRQKECRCHNHVEWGVDYTNLFQSNCTVNSPAFEIGAQRYLFELNAGNYGVHVTILRSGPSSHRPRRIFLGVKLSDGSYDHKIKENVVSLEKKCEFWTRAVWFPISTKTLVENHHLGPNKLFTLFLRMDDGQSDGEPDTCIQDIGSMSPRCVGSISEENWASYKTVEWSLEFEFSSGIVTSPFFSVAEQNYIWELGCDRKGSHHLRLYRMGPSISKSVRLWSFVMKGDQLYTHHASQCQVLDLEDERCGMWREVGKPLLLEDLNGRMNLIIGFLMERQSNTPLLADDESRGDFKPVPKEYIVLSVKDMEYKIDKAVLVFRVPIFKAMFSHDCVESRTGVVIIEDCEPEVCRAFLDFVYSGEQEIVTSMNVSDLYSVAFKYIFKELDSACSHQRFLDSSSPSARVVKTKNACAST